VFSYYRICSLAIDVCARVPRGERGVTIICHIIIHICHIIICARAPRGERGVTISVSDRSLLLYNRSLLLYNRSILRVCHEVRGV